MLAQGPQAVESAEPLEHSPQWGRHAGLVRVLVEPPQHRELQERQGQGAAVIHLKTSDTPPSSEQQPGRFPVGSGRVGCHFTSSHPGTDA